MRISDWSSDVCSSDLPICAMQACMDGFELVSPFIDGINDGTEGSIDKALLGKIDLIVTTTGNVNVCDANMLKALKKRAVVCNIGHFDNEIDRSEKHPSELQSLMRISYAVFCLKKTNASRNDRR